MPLWQFNSDALGGFYRSDVIVEAPGREEAVARALAGVVAWIEEEAKEGWSVHVKAGFLDPAEDRFREARADFMRAIEEEARARLEEVPGGVLVQKSL